MVPKVYKKKVKIKISNNSMGIRSFERIKRLKRYQQNKIPYKVLKES